MADACGLRIALVPHLPYHEHEASPADVLETGSHLGLGCLSEGGAWLTLKVAAWLKLKVASDVFMTGSLPFDTWPIGSISACIHS